MSPRVGLPFVLGILLTGCLPATATAGTVALEPGVSVSDQILTYRAAPGERNDLTVSRGEGLVRVVDAAGVTPGPGCQPEAGNERTVAQCPLEQDPNALWLFLGDRRDRAQVGDFALGGVLLVGGAGDDRLSSGNALAAVFVGGRGSDVMQTGGGETIFDEGSRRNGSDTMSVKPGAVYPLVWVDYGSRRRPVRVDLGRGRNDGEAGERDMLGRGIYGVRGGAGADRLVGDGGNNALEGGAGADRLFGRGGHDALAAIADQIGTRPLPGTAADRVHGGHGSDFLLGSGGPNVLAGGPGPDEVLAGAGPDVISTRDDAVDDVRCGDGRDRTIEDEYDVRQNCERTASRFANAVPFHLDAWLDETCRGGTGLPCGPPYLAAVSVACPGPEEGCRGSVRLEVDGQAVATSAFENGPLRAPDSNRFVINEEVYRLIARRDPRVAVVVLCTGGPGKEEVRMRAPQLRVSTGHFPIFPIWTGFFLEAWP
jgi:hypothetical protein